MSVSRTSTEAPLLRSARAASPPMALSTCHPASRNRLAANSSTKPSSSTISTTRPWGIAISPGESLFSRSPLERGKPLSHNSFLYDLIHFGSNTQAEMCELLQCESNNLGVSEVILLGIRRFAQRGEEIGDRL